MNIARLAERLHKEASHLELASEIDWSSLDEGERQSYLELTERVLMDWRLVELAHIELVSPERVIDVEEARKALAEAEKNGAVTLEDFKKELGI